MQRKISSSSFWWESVPYSRCQENKAFFQLLYRFIDVMKPNKMSSLGTEHNIDVDCNKMSFWTIDFSGLFDGWPFHILYLVFRSSQISLIVKQLGGNGTGSTDFRKWGLIEAEVGGEAWSPHPVSSPVFLQRRKLSRMSPQPAHFLCKRKGSNLHTVIL